MEQNLNLYHIFYTVAKCRNISGAARQLFISQPAISKAISRLEQNLNTVLFLRSSRGVRLTETGELLYRQVESAFQAISQGEEQLRDDMDTALKTMKEDGTLTKLSIEYTGSDYNSEE